MRLRGATLIGAAAAFATVGTVAILFVQYYHPAKPIAAVEPDWTSCSGGYVAFTYDDGPDPVFTPVTLKALAHYDIRATFFTVGANVKANPELVRQEVALGHSVQDHTMTHPDLRTYTVAASMTELGQAADAIVSAGAPRPTFFRAPYDHSDDDIRLAARKAGLIEVGFTVDTNDWKDPGVAAIVRAVSQVRPGGILQMHDRGHAQSAQAMPAIVGLLAKRHLCPGRLTGTEARNTDAPAYLDFFAKAVAW